MCGEVVRGGCLFAWTFTVKRSAVQIVLSVALTSRPVSSEWSELYHFTHASNFFRIRLFEE